MKRWLSAAIVAAATLGSAAAPADHASLFGLQIGAPIKLPPCQPDASGVVGPDGQHAMCWARAGSDIGAMPTDGELHVYFAGAAVPEFLANDEVIVTMRQGVVDHMLAVTTGLFSQESVFSGLASRMGPAAAASKIPAQNMAGARFAIRQGLWITKANDLVLFTGSNGDVHHGKIEVFSESAAKTEGAALQANRPPQL